MKTGARNGRHDLLPCASDYASISSTATDLFFFSELSAAKLIRTGCKPSFPVTGVSSSLATTFGERF
jgi:hypothetical protein